MSAAAYDVFVSYRHEAADRRWVRELLVPRLLADGLDVCVDYLTFRLGSPLVLEMAAAVEASRYTLAVLTPAYVASTFTELENVLAEHLGLEQAARRLLYVLREPTDAPLRIRARAWFDMSSDEEFPQAVARLCQELRRDPRG